VKQLTINEELDALETAEKRATPGPWVYNVNWGIIRSNPPRGEKEVVLERAVNQRWKSENAELLAKARNALPRLIAEVRLLRMQVKLYDDLMVLEHPNRSPSPLLLHPGRKLGEP
jgi:hypothetical protein